MFIECLRCQQTRSIKALRVEAEGVLLIRGLREAPRGSEATGRVGAIP